MYFKVLTYILKSRGLRVLFSTILCEVEFLGLFSKCCVIIPSVESIFLNGTGKRIVNTLPPATFMGVLGGFLYWVDGEGTIVRADKFTGGDVVVLATLNYQPTRLQVFAKERQNCKLCLKFQF